MTDNERELLNMIRNHPNPEAALKGALDIIVAYLAQHESCQGPSSAVLPVSA